VKISKARNYSIIAAFMSILLAVVLVATGCFTRIEYQNDQYGFSFSLPESWKGYSIVTDKWNGTAQTDTGPTGDTTVMQGPLIFIRNPAWTAQKPYQDIPVMVFTLSQWDSLLRGTFLVSPAPGYPSRIGFNANYVFAIPQRYNYAFPIGYEEVEKILQNNPLRALPSTSTISDDGKVLLCGGIPNGSTQNITGTTRLFINLPKDIYPDKEHNLQFKTARGNAIASWVSNAGPYGEGFGAEDIPDCWSYYYEFDGKGEVDLTVKNATKNAPSYYVRFIVSLGK